MEASSGGYSSIGHVVVDRETYAWWWRLISFLSSFLILGGFVTLQPLFEDDPQLRSSKVLLTVITVAFLTAGFSLTGLLCFACRDARYQLDVILTPALFATVTGLFSVLYAITISSRYEWETASIIGVVLGIVGSIAYISLAVLAYHRHIAPETQPSNLPGKRLKRLFNRNAPAAPSQNPIITIVPGEAPVQIITNGSRSEEDELTRQQMLSLLKARENMRGRGSDASLRETYNIEMPSVTRDVAGNRLSMPPHVRDYYSPIDDSQSEYPPPKFITDARLRQDSDLKNKETTRLSTLIEDPMKPPAPAAESNRHRSSSRNDRRTEIEQQEARARSRSRDLRRREIELGHSS